MTGCSLHLLFRKLSFWKRFGFLVCWSAAAFLFSPAAVGFDHLHSLSPAYHASVIEAEESGTYTFHSPGISYGAVLGRPFGARLRVTAFFPTQLFQEGEYFHARDYYSPAFGGEVQLAAAYALSLRNGERLIFDLGPDFAAMKLDSRVYSAFMSATLGIAGGAEYTYRLHRFLTLGVFVTVAIHFVDFIHETNALKFGAFITTGLTLGLHFEGKKGDGG